MNQPAPSLDQLRLAWERCLLAKVQVIELQAWGESTVGLVRRTVEEYAELEAAYIAAMVARRRQHAESKKGGSAKRG
jgi:hypothetical protein